MNKAQRTNTRMQTHKDEKDIYYLCEAVDCFTKRLMKGKKFQLNINKCHAHETVDYLKSFIISAVFFSFEHDDEQSARLIFIYNAICCDTVSESSRTIAIV